jgi:hypothetical protein
VKDYRLQHSCNADALDEKIRLDISDSLFRRSGRYTRSQELKEKSRLLILLISGRAYRANTKSDRWKCNRITNRAWR